jgi:thymidylate synthase ThyX
MTKRCIEAKIVADSINSRGCRITTFTVVFPRFILAEFNTHRAFSRNSASSRARPFQVTLKEVRDDPFIPIRWMSTHKGMQGTDYLDEAESKAAVVEWLKARDLAVEQAIKLDHLRVTKQLVNRMLEPYMWHEVIVTATSFENFFALRAHADAEIHIAALAEAMLKAYNLSTPSPLKAGEWHIPFSEHMNQMKLSFLIDEKSSLSTAEQVEVLKRSIACARCARISYRPFGSEDCYDYAADLKLFNQLLNGGHMSPLEHCARAMTDAEWHDTSPTNSCGNFRGFIQYRKQFANECRIDSRAERKSFLLK